MARENYAACLAATLKYEGGKSDDPRDPGGRTNQGVTQATYDTHRARKGLPRADVYTMAAVERDEIYRRGYWDVVHGDALRPGEDLVVFDYAVNSGPTRALSVWRACSAGQAPVEVVIRSICAERLAFLKRLPTWPVFGKGWAARVASVEKLALGMASKPAAVPAPKVSTAAKAGAGASAIVVATGSAAGGANWIGWPDWTAYLIIGIGFALVLLLGLIAALAKKPETLAATAPPAPSPLDLPKEGWKPAPTSTRPAERLKANMGKLSSVGSAWDQIKADIAKDRADMKAEAEALLAAALESEKQEAAIEAFAPANPAPIAPPVAPAAAESTITQGEAA